MTYKNTVFDYFRDGYFTAMYFTVFFRIIGMRQIEKKGTTSEWCRCRFWIKSWEAKVLKWQLGNGWIPMEQLHDPGSNSGICSYQIYQKIDLRFGMVDDNIDFWCSTWPLTFRNESVKYLLLPLLWQYRCRDDFCWSYLLVLGGRDDHSGAAWSTIMLLHVYKTKKWTNSQQNSPQSS